MRRSIRKSPENAQNSPFRVIDRGFFNPENYKNLHAKPASAKPARRGRPLNEAKYEVTMEAHHRSSVATTAHWFIPVMFTTVSFLVLASCGDDDGGSNQLLCSPSETRCSMGNVERCSADGSSWMLVEECPVACRDGSCTCSDAVEEDCPGHPEMARVGSYCIDKWEASRCDASAASPGHDDSQACSQPNVVAWTPGSWSGADAACRAAGKRLCTGEERTDACDGVIGEGGCAFPDGLSYSSCLVFAAYGMSAFDEALTGEMDGCKSFFGVYDLVGNYTEWCDQPGYICDCGAGASEASTANCQYGMAESYPNPTNDYFGLRCCLAL